MWFRKALMSGCKSSYKYVLTDNKYFGICLMKAIKHDATDYHLHDKKSISILLKGKYHENRISKFITSASLSTNKVRWFPGHSAYINKEYYHQIVSLSKTSWILCLSFR